VQLYGPGTGNVKPTGSAPLHVDAAAQAALLAVERGITGIFNMLKTTGLCRLKRPGELGWDPGFRIATREAAENILKARLIDVNALQ